MNEPRWDAIADAYARGDLIPPNQAEWQHLAWKDVQLIGLILHTRGVETITEVGCGIARLTSMLARHFRYVVATDTSPRCREVTIRACAGLRNVSVCHPDAASGTDAAVVWGNLYDQDWPDATALEHITSLLATHTYALIQTTRPAILNLPFRLQAANYWTLLPPVYPHKRG